MALLVSSTTTVFSLGTFRVDLLSIDPKRGDASSPPKPLFIVTPTMEGVYPVLVFIHGTSLECTFYTQLLKHVASHGYIVVAPQIYTMMPPSGQSEINSAADVTNWLQKGLQATLPQCVQPDLLKLILLGHSRGGKTAFSLALGQGKTSLTFKGLIGIDPVAGWCKACQINPKVLTYKPQSFNLGIPVMVIGTGLGNVKKNCSFPVCAPNGVSHNEFYYECQATCYHFVTSEYGHMDMLDDQPKGCMGRMMSKCMCKNGGGPRDPMRRCVGGLIVAFAISCLEGKSMDLNAILEKPTIAPTKLDPVEYREL